MMVNIMHVSDIRSIGLEKGIELLRRFAIAYHSEKSQRRVRFCEVEEFRHLGRAVGFDAAERRDIMAAFAKVVAERSDVPPYSAGDGSAAVQEFVYLENSHFRPDSPNFRNRSLTLEVSAA